MFEAQALLTIVPCGRLPCRLLTFLLILLLLALTYRTASTGLAMRRTEQQAQRHLSPLPGGGEQRGQQQQQQPAGATEALRRCIRRHSRPPSPKLVVELGSLDGQAGGRQQQRQKQPSCSSRADAAGGRARDWQIPAAAAAADADADEKGVQQEAQQAGWRLRKGSPRQGLLPKRPVSAPPAVAAGGEGQRQPPAGGRQKERARSSLDALSPASPPRHDGPAIEEASSADGSSHGGSSSGEGETYTAKQ